MLRTWTRRCYVGVFLFSATNTLSAVAHIGEGDPKGEFNPSTFCEGTLLGTETLTDDVVLSLESHSILDLVVRDLTKNLAARHFGILMSAAQRATLQIGMQPVKTVPDPYYRVDQVRIFPLFSSAGEESGYNGIVGQYQAVEALVDYVSGNDRVRNKGALLLVGPPGTGKSAMTEVLANARAHYANNDPRFYEFTFVWKDLGKIPKLRAMGNAVGEFASQLGLSPFVLLPTRVQKQLLAQVGPEFKRVFGEDPRPPTYRDPQTDAIYEALVSHYFGNTPPSEAQAVAMLDRHVRVVRRIFRAKDMPGVIGYQGDEPRLDLLFGSEDLARSAEYGPASPLSANFLGLVPRANGGLLMLDEFFRNRPELVNALLGLTQGGRMDFGTHPVNLDVVVILATNDKSIELAEGRESQGAGLSRFHQVAMRSVLHPAEIQKIALVNRGLRNFEMRRLGQPDAQWEKASANSLFPDPDERGILDTPDHKYSIAALSAKGTRILIAPHTLAMMGNTVAMTRFVTDPKKLLGHKELDVLTNHPVFMNTALRLEALTGRIHPEAAVRSELRRATYLMKEGEGGINARDVDRWLMIGLNLAETRQTTLTPVLMDEAFGVLLTEHSIHTPNEVKAKWIAEHADSKAKFTLPAIARDITAILGGERGRATSMYDTLRKIIGALVANPSATHYEADSGEKVAIDRVQLQKIAEVYHREIGRELVFAGISNFHLNHEGKRDPDLLRAIEAFLLDTVVETNTLTDLLNAVTGQQAPSQQVAAMVGSIDRVLADHGYDRPAFIEALRFVRDMKAEASLREQQR